MASPPRIKKAGSADVIDVQDALEEKKEKTLQKADSLEVEVDFVDDGIPSDEEAKKFDQCDYDDSRSSISSCESCCECCELNEVDIGDNWLNPESYGHSITKGVFTKWWMSIPPVDGNSHFENLNSTNWNTLRFKPPPSQDSKIGWRVEIRPVDM